MTWHPDWPTRAGWAGHAERVLAAVLELVYSCSSSALDTQWTCVPFAWFASWDRFSGILAGFGKSCDDTEESLMSGLQEIFSLRLKS